MADFTSNARELRRSQTDAEKRLWYHLRNRQFLNLKFRRQHPIPPYIADFFCEELKLIIELDGGQHTPDTDEQRTRFLEKEGYTLIRFWNNDMLNNTEGVLETLAETIKSLPSPDPLTAARPLPEGEVKVQRIQLGKIATAHGIKGLVKVLVYATDPALLNGALYTGETGNDSLTVTMKNSMGKYWLAAIDGVNDRNAAELLRGKGLWAERDTLPAPDEDEVYYDDLIGMNVQTAQGDPVGTVIAVDNFGAGDLLEIKPTDGGAAFYLPFAEQYVLETDLETKTITVEIPEGLR